MVKPALELVPHQQGHSTGYQCKTVDLQPSYFTSPWQDGYTGAQIWNGYGQNELSVPPAMTMQPVLGNCNNFTTAEHAQWNWTSEDFITNEYVEQSLSPVVTEPQFDLAAEAGLQQPVPAPLPASFNTPAAARQERLTCLEGCSETFNRPGDFRRHMLKHAPPKFKCVDIDCKKTFYRMDKLRQHAKQGHKINL
jgi:hypothetical protein